MGGTVREREGKGDREGRQTDKQAKKQIGRVGDTYTRRTVRLKKRGGGGRRLERGGTEMEGEKERGID